LEKEIQSKFSQRWEIYRVATHELGGVHLIPLMSTTYSTKDLYNILEVLDVHDTFKKMAVDKQKAQQANKNKGQP